MDAVQLQAFEIATLLQHGSCWIAISKKNILYLDVCILGDTMDQVYLLGAQTRLNTH